MSTPVALQFVVLLALMFPAAPQKVGLEQSWRALEAGEVPVCWPRGGGRPCSLKAVTNVEGLACGWPSNLRPICAGRHMRVGRAVARRVYTTTAWPTTGRCLGRGRYVGPEVALCVGSSAQMAKCARLGAMRLRRPPSRRSWLLRAWLGVHGCRLGARHSGTAARCGAYGVGGRAVRRRRLDGRLFAGGRLRVARRTAARSRRVQCASLAACLDVCGSLQTQRGRA